MKVIHIIGAPATGKTHLRQRLAQLTGLPSIAIDDERVKALLPGERWPSRDNLAWEALGEHVRNNPVSIVETSGSTYRSDLLLMGHQVLTIMCKATPHTRAVRLRQRASEGGPMVGNPRRYVEHLYRMGDPKVIPDVTWDSDDDGATDGPEQAVHGFLA